MPGQIGVNGGRSLAGVLPQMDRSDPEKNVSEEEEIVGDRFRAIVEK